MGIVVHGIFKSKRRRSQLVINVSDCATLCNSFMNVDLVMILKHVHVTPNYPFEIETKNVVVKPVERNRNVVTSFVKVTGRLNTSYCSSVTFACMFTSIITCNIGTH